MLALTGCASLEPSAPGPPVAEPKARTTAAPQPVVAPAASLLAVEEVGGMCSSGKECRHVVTLEDDGRWRTDDDTGDRERGTIDDTLLAQVAHAVATADRDRLTATPFTGQCERDMDGTELLITLRPGAADELVLSSCVYELPTEGPLVDAVLALWEATA